MNHILRYATLVVSIVAFAPPVSAQSVLNSGEFQAERFEPMAAQGTAILNVAKSDVVPHGLPSVGLFAHYSNDPVVLRTADGETALLADSLNLEVLAAFGLGDFFDLGIALPVVAYQSGSDLAAIGKPGQELDAFALQDLRITPRLQILNADEFAGFGFAFLTSFGLPMGDDLNTDGALRIEPRVAFDYRYAGVVLAANAAYTFRERAAAQDYVANDAFRWSFGLEAPTGVERLGAVATVFGDVNVSNRRDPDNLTVELDETPTGPIEWLLGAQYTFENALVANIGGGTGLNGGVGSPDFRIFASLGYTPRTRDRDGDGLMDDVDQCRDFPEDIDGYEDQDGCPDEDNDSDGLMDDVDQCPDEAEDRDEFKDDDGCPDLDNDQDTILDTEDECPVTAGVAALNGCPIIDKDNDGLLDAEDKCPEDPEDKDGFEDEDGCPDYDNDGDRLLDVEEACPNQPEDFDGFEDEDGCPDPDNDRDGVLDKDDKCPNEAEVINGVDDEDGCPDKGKSKVRITKTKIEILERVFFDTGKATIKTRSHNLLNQVAQVLKANAQITSVQIEGHTDDRGADAFNLELSQKRAEAVRDYVATRGVATERLVAKGFGETRPIAPNKTKKGREQNRRVEFNIVSINGKPVGAEGAIIEKEEVIPDEAPETSKSTETPVEAKP